MNFIYFFWNYEIKNNTEELCNLPTKQSHENESNMSKDVNLVFKFQQQTNNLVWKLYYLTTKKEWKFIQTVYSDRHLETTDCIVVQFVLHNTFCDF